MLLQPIVRTPIVICEGAQWGLLYEITQDQCNLISVIKIHLGLQCFIWITSDNQTNIIIS
jgi:hypothetical protein